jgi:thiamine pyrophosphate-dependent acetolactate synthase large subunit-like protein
MKVYQRLAADFVAEGVTHIFGIMGDGNMYWMHELDKLGGVKMLEVRHEGAGLGMADGWARVTSTPGVATTTCGPGVSQLATALLTASRAASPLVAFCGEYPSNDDEYLQRMDQAAFAASCETGFIRIASPEVADDCVRKAFYRAKLESRPIMLSAPMDVQQMAFEDDDEPYKPSSAVLPKRVVHPDPAEIEKAADIIAGAKHPVVLVGRGAKWSGAGDAVKKLSGRIGALIATSLMVKGWLAEDEYHVGISGTHGTRTAISCSRPIASSLSARAWAATPLNTATSTQCALRAPRLEATPRNERGPFRRLLRADGRQSRRRSLGERAREALGQDDRLSHRRGEETARYPARRPRGLPDRAGRRGSEGDLPGTG